MDTVTVEQRKLHAVPTGLGMAFFKCKLFNLLIQLISGVKDPNLWRVKCRIGDEQITAIKLMRKFINLEINDAPLQIKSVVVPVGVKG